MFPTIPIVYYVWNTPWWHATARHIMGRVRHVCPVSGFDNTGMTRGANVRFGSKAAVGRLGGSMSAFAPKADSCALTRGRARLC